MKTASMIMARMASTRLPGKVLMNLNNKPALQHVIERCKRSKVNDIIVICTDDKEDMKIIKLCIEHNYKYFIGKGKDVIKQMLGAAEKFKVDIIADVTADCPLVDPKHIDIILKNFFKRKVLYASNILPRTFPDGFDIQVYKTETLETINYIVSEGNIKARRDTGWNIAKMADTKDAWTLKTNDSRSKPEMRLTLDTQEDFRILNHIFSYFKHNRFSFLDVMDYIEKFPGILELNQNVKSTTPGL